MSPSPKLKIPVSKDDHSQGPDQAPLVLVEYGDYQCPHCGRAYPMVKRLQKALGDKLKFVFRNFPLSEAHPDALNAAKVAEAAALQKKFWEMHDMLFENQQNLDVESLAQYAEKLKLDVGALNDAVAESSVEDRVSTDFEGGVRSGVNGTPTFFVNGFRYDGDWSYGPFLGALKAVLGQIESDD
ncbi:MAG TPA: DsbA family protein [bacterium]|jgi:protein-disulfide isomerase|nr:DsbA family protein [bacterium]